MSLRKTGEEPAEKGPAGMPKCPMLHASDRFIRFGLPATGHRAERRSATQLARCRSLVVRETDTTNRRRIRMQAVRILLIPRLRSRDGLPRLGPWRRATSINRAGLNRSVYVVNTALSIVRMALSSLPSLDRLDATISR